MDGGSFWSDGWSWNASTLIQDWWLLAVWVILAVLIVSAGILAEVSFAARAKRRNGSGGNARTSSRSNTSC